MSFQECQSWGCPPWTFCQCWFGGSEGVTCQGHTAIEPVILILSTLLSCVNPEFPTAFGFPRGRDFSERSKAPSQISCRMQLRSLSVILPWGRIAMKAGAPRSPGGDRALLWSAISAPHFCPQEESFVCIIQPQSPRVWDVTVRSSRLYI